MEISNIANNPMTFTINGKDYAIKRLSLLDLFAEFEVEVKSQYKDEVADYASRIKDPKERMDYQKQMMKDMPKGEVLAESVRQFMDTTEGGIKLLYLSLNKFNKVTIQEVKDMMIDPKNQIVISNLISYATGSDAIVEEKEETHKDVTIIETEKKTANI